MKIERQLQGNLNTILSVIIRERDLENKIQPFPTNEEHRADITLKNKSGKPIFFIELKDPTSKNGRSVFDSETVLRELERAQKYEIRYFGICNFLACAFFDGNNINNKVAISEGFFTIQEITRLSNNFLVTKEIEKKLRTIGEFYIERALEIIERKSLSFAQPDELYIFKIRKLIEAYSPSITEKIWDKYNSEKKFGKEIKAYCQSQLWTNPEAYDEIENLSHIALLMLISKIIFYKAYVDNQTWHNLSPMKIGKEIETAEALENLIWEYFTEFKDVTGDFELLIGERSDIIFQMPFVCDSVIELVFDLLETDRFYDFSKIPYDIIGRIFEELIREDERHKLGQYFTPPHVIDLIISFAINSDNDKVFDPSCGSGTFLVRAYERKKLLSQVRSGGYKRHEILLSEIYGNDLSGYPAYLSMLNLSIRNTRHKSYPRIINKDFFSLGPTTKIEIHNNQGEIERKLLPSFHAIIGNPPYTRQEEIGAIQGTVKKDVIQEIVKRECGIYPSQRTSIYAYFFYHASAFLKDRGYLAYIVQNSWLDTDYGIDLQKYLLRTFEIIAIMDSEVERFFPTASVNTSIVILRKQANEEIRNDNTVRFVYFREFLLKTTKFYGGTEKLKSFIENTLINLANDYFKINCVKQSELINYTKWGQFLKAPRVYFEIIEKAKEKFLPLGKRAEVIRGYMTGCNDFFIVKNITHLISDNKITAVVNNSYGFESLKEIIAQKLAVVENGLNEYWLIEEKLLKPMLTSPKDVKKYACNPGDLPYSVFLAQDEISVIEKKFPYAFRYIIDAENKNIHKASSLAARKIWYELGEKEVPTMSFNYVINEFGRTFLVKAFSNNNFHNIYTKQNTHTIWLYMNSTISWLIQQLVMRSNLGEGAGKIETYELADFLIPDINLENLKIDLGETRNYKEEFGSLENLKTVNPDRLKLDSAILEAIGFTDKEERDEILYELYKSTYQLIDSRLHKAQSLKSVNVQRNKTEFSAYIEQLKHLIEEEKLKPTNTLTFAKQIQKLVNQITSVIALQKKILETYWQWLYNEPFNEKQIAAKAQNKLF